MMPRRSTAGHTNVLVFIVVALVVHPALASAVTVTPPVIPASFTLNATLTIPSVSETPVQINAWTDAVLGRQGLWFSYLESHNAYYIDTATAIEYMAQPSNSPVDDVTYTNCVIADTSATEVTTLLPTLDGWTFNGTMDHPTYGMVQQYIMTSTQGDQLSNYAYYWSLDGTTPYALTMLPGYNFLLFSHIDNYIYTFTSLNTSRPDSSMLTPPSSFNCPPSSSSENDVTPRRPRSLPQTLPDQSLPRRRSAFASTEGHTPLRRTSQDAETFILPDEIDWRAMGAVTSVKDQGFCISGYAFSAIGALEGAVFLATGHLPTLSPQSLIDCSWSQNNTGCLDGTPWNCFDFLIKAGGQLPPNATVYPTTGLADVCGGSFKTGDDESRDLENDESSRDAPPRRRHDEVEMVAGETAYIVNYTTIQSGNETAMAEALALYGPLSASINLAESIASYTGGIYYEPLCNNTIEYVTHHFTVVGYGSLGPGQDYWICKNQWGTEWGVDGYIWMARNRDNNCGIATAAMYPILTIV